MVTHMSREVISHKEIERFPFEGLVFIPCLSNGEIIDGTDCIFYKDGEFLSYPLEKDLDDIKIFKNYLIKYI